MSLEPIFPPYYPFWWFKLWILWMQIGIVLSIMVLLLYVVGPFILKQYTRRRLKNEVS